MVNNTLDDNTTFWSPYYTALENALAGFGIVDGCAISKGTADWDIDVTSGTVVIAGTGRVSVSSGTVTISDSSGLSSGQSRIDLITADTGGTLAAVEGSGATNPDAPDVPSDEVILGFVVVADTDSTAADSDIIDIPALPSYDHSVSDPSDVSGSRSAGTWVENTDDSARVVYVTAKGTTSSGSNEILIDGHINSSQSNQIVVRNKSRHTDAADALAGITMTVPAGNFYKVEISNTSGSGTSIDKWFEHNLQTA